MAASCIDRPKRNAHPAGSLQAAYSKRHVLLSGTRLHEWALGQIPDGSVLVMLSNPMNPITRSGGFRSPAGSEAA